MTLFIIFLAKYLVFLSPILLVYLVYKSDTETRKKIIGFAVISLPITYILGVIARKLYFNPRPFMVSGVEPLIAHAPDNGFPSDHILLLAALACVVCVFNKKLSAWLWLITILVAIARIYAGVHHTIDIAGSIVIALVSAAMAYAIIRPSWNKNNQANF